MIKYSLEVRYVLGFFLSCFVKKKNLIRLLYVIHMKIFLESRYVSTLNYNLCGFLLFFINSGSLRSKIEMI
jgi:hypothetical protein